MANPTQDQTHEQQPTPQPQPQPDPATALLNPAALLERLRRIPVFATLTEQQMRCFDHAEQLHLQPGDLTLVQGEEEKHFWVLLHGGIRVYQTHTDGSQITLGSKVGQETFGEVPLLAGIPNAANAEITEPSLLIRLDEDGFWNLMVACPLVRAAILRNMSLRLQSMQDRTLQREKLVSLGTLAAGLMHELNNPGSAAKRAASQLRENLTRLQQMSLRFSHVALTEEQWKCMEELQQQALLPAPSNSLNSLEQSDAEEALAAWLESNQVENAWKLAPTLASIGMDQECLACARTVYQGPMFSDSLNWLEALISSMQMVATIEESIGRVTDLVHAVKKYSYEDKAETHTLDVNDSLRSTLVVLAHKFRAKDVRLTKELAADLPPIQTQGAGLNQVWTNLLDNALDAVSNQGAIKIRTWLDGEEVCVSIADNGGGISEECKPHVFELFFTTKPVGEGTGLGLDIAHRIVVGRYGGDIRFTSSPEGTEFTVRLPLHRGATPPAA